MKKIIYIILVLVLLGGISSCELEPTLEQEKDVEKSINTVEDLQGLAYGIYERFSSSDYYGRNLIIFNEVRTDNCYDQGHTSGFIYIGQMETGGVSTSVWGASYRVIASANIIIGTDLDNITGDAAEVNHIVGQAYAARALAYFDLLKLYGQQHVINGVSGEDGPLAISYVKEYKDEVISVPRNSVNEVKSFIEEDLARASSLMSASLDNPSRTEFTTDAVFAIQTRVALYFKEWARVKTAAEAIINSGKYRIVEADEYIGSWSTDGSANSIFELAFSNTDNDADDNLYNIYRHSSMGDIVALEDLVNAFDGGDVRGTTDMIAWDGLYWRNMGKYPSPDFSDNVSLIRYEEIILSLAEALMELGDPNALSYLNMVPSKRNATLYTEATIENILLERRKEFCFEGFRFDDLVRTGTGIPLVDATYQAHGGALYGDHRLALKIPQSEMEANNKMVQNYGY